MPLTSRPRPGMLLLLRRFRLLVLLLLATSAAVVVAFKAAPVPTAASTSNTCPLSSSSSISSSSSSSNRMSRAAAASADTTAAHPPISRVGFGTYRVGNSREQAAAIREALLNGLTLVDTSANYGDGDSERTIGLVVRELVGEGKLRREDLVLVSKFGYIQGQNYARYESGEVVTPDTVHYGQGLKHCVHPDFMEDQLTRSLERLGLPSLDCFLLHNPEYYLTANVKPGVTTEAELATHRAEMERRLFEAFKALEAEISSGKGRLRSYGISSNSFSLPASHPHFLRYDNLVELAEKAAREVAAAGAGAAGHPGHHHFRAIQLPANLVEQEGLDHAVQWARGQGLVVLINRPLNAFDDDRRIYLRLAEYADATGEYEGAKAALLAFIEQRLAGGDERYAVFQKEVERLDGELDRADNVLAWENVVGRMVVPALRRGLEATTIDAEGRFDEEAMRLSQAFIDAAEHQVAHRSGVAARQAVETELGLGPLPAGQSLQECAIEWLLAKPGVTCVLLGCRNTRYVKDAIQLVQKHPPLRTFDF